MRGETRGEGPIVFRGREEIRDRNSPSGFSWRAIALGVVATCITFAVLAAIAWLLIRSGVVPNLASSNGGRTLVLIAVLGLVVSFAFGTGFGVRLSSSHSSILVGPVVAIIVLVISSAVAFPFVERMADFRSVAIALEIIDAPDVGTRVGGTLDRLVMNQKGSSDAGTADPVSAAWDHVRATLWYAAAVVAALVTAASLGVALGRHSARFSGRNRFMRTGVAAGLAAVGSGTAILTLAVWPHIPPVYGALFDFDQSAGQEVGVSLSEVARHPEVMWGQTVTVSARVEQPLNPHALLLGNNKPIVGDSVLVVGESELGDLILLPQQADVDIQKGEILQVTGVVRQYDPAELKASLGVDLDHEGLSGYESQAVLVAEAIDVDVPIAAAAGDQEFGSSTGYDRGVTIGDVVTNPDQYEGLTVTMSGEIEEHLLMPHTFLLGDDALLVVSKAARPELFVEATAYVTGEVRLFNLQEIERELGIDLDNEALRSYEGQPVIVVESLAMVK